MLINIFSDPHLGAVRNAHTTPASRVQLRQALYEAALSASEPGRINYCLGDLFDDYTPSGASLSQALDVVQNTEFVLAGNHDFANRTDTLSGVEVLMKIWSVYFESAESRLGQASFAEWQQEGVLFCAVGHKLTQSLFEDSLVLAEQRAAQHKGDTVLFLHCNYNSPYALNASTLNLTESRAADALNAFSYIFIGHEHMARRAFNNRLVLVGNTHPTSFADISTKHRWEVEVVAGKVVSVNPIVIWSAPQGYLTVSATTLLQGGFVPPPEVQFLEVTGEVESSLMPEVARTFAKLWSTSPALLMIRNSVTCASVSVEVQAFSAYEDVPTRIAKNLVGTGLEGLWQDYLGRISA